MTRRELLVFALILVAWSEALQAEPIATEERLHDGSVIVTLGEKKYFNEMGVYPPGGVPHRPLLIVAHGNGDTGRRQIGDWIALAKQHRLTVVSPTFVSVGSVRNVTSDAPFFNDCLHWIEKHLEYDKASAYMTGYSGGAFSVWYLATKRPDFFRGLFFQSGNFGGEIFNLDLLPWRDRPICLVWGQRDIPMVIEQNIDAAALLQSKHFTNFSSQVIPGAGHQPQRDRVIGWIESQPASLSDE